MFNNDDRGIMSSHLKRRLPTALAAVALLAVPAVALADNLVDNVDSTADGKIVSIANGATSDDIGIRLNATGGSCDLGAGEAIDVTITAASGSPTVSAGTGTTLHSENTLRFTRCNAFQYIKLSSTMAGDHSIGATITKVGATTGNFVNHVGFTLRVGTPANTDTTAPAITITTPVNGASYLLGQSVFADYGCDDGAGSGVALCRGTVANGAAIDTSSVGSKSFKVDTEDNAGNTRSLTHTYSVIYDFTGFFRPVDNDGVLNVVKAGSSVPVKFSLAGNQGLGVVSAIKSQPIACETSALQDPLEETAAPGSSGLSYDSSVDQYNYVWKTDKAWAGTCREFKLTLNDGTSQPARFKLTK